MDYQQYEFTRTIRFNLSGDDKRALMLDLLDDTQEGMLAAFQETYKNLLFAFQEAILRADGSGNLRVGRLEIKKSWLRQYAREYFYALSEDERRCKNKFQAKLFDRVLSDWLERNNELLQRLNNILSLPQESKTGASDLSLLVRQLKGAEYFYFIRDFTQSGIINDKDSDEHIKNLAGIVEKFETLLDKVLFLTAPNSSQGVETTRASFNYYTVNKISKNFDENIKKANGRLCSSYQNSMNEELLRKVGFLKYLKDEYRAELQNVSLKDLYEALKKFKSQQKTAFIQAVQKNKSEQELMREFPLFNGEQPDTLQKFILETDKIKRGAYFQKWGFDNYISFCNKIFKPVAMETGTRKAEIRALEQEKIEARLLQYWAHILVKDGKYFLLLIPKEKMGEAKVFFARLSDQEGGEYTLYAFNSLTLRALKKLIRRNLGKEQVRLSAGDADAIALCQEVLRGRYHQLKDLDLSGFEKEIAEIANTQYENEEEFRIALEQVAYYLSERKMNEESIEYLKKNLGAILLEISSYDLERNITGESKEHTRLWSDFWNPNNKKECFSTRLNPELRIFYRPPREQKDPKKQKNRFSKDHLAVAFTIAQNAARKRMETSFAEEKDLVEQVKKFNEEVVGKFIDEKSDNLYYYGIDRGQQELATLCVVRFSKEHYEAMLEDNFIKKFSKPIPAQITAYRIKDEHMSYRKNITRDLKGNETEEILFKNPSHFIDEVENFEEVSTPCIDLTTAKLIKGKIILNGDIQTYLALKKANGKRQLFEKFAKIDDSAKIEFDDSEGRFQVKSKATEREEYQFLPYYGPEQENISPREDMRRELQAYLDKLRSSESFEEDISIEKINHLRDAITSNMVGIIAFLFTEYPGIINLENLHSRENIEKNWRKNNEDISRRLEWGLYKKFQKIGLVPPRLRQTVLLRENETERQEKLNQFGIIHFIPTEKTSARCPYCGENTPMKQRNEDKFKLHAYICRSNEENCGFDTREPKSPLEFIKNSDDVAAYNIAKKRL